MFIMMVELNGKLVDSVVNSFAQKKGKRSTRLVGDSFSGAFRAHKCNAIIYKSAAENITQK